MKIIFISLGCDKNLVDTEMMIGILQKNGYEFTDDENEADIAVVNTCCFIGDAKEESINTLLELAQLKNIPDSSLNIIVAAGCLAQRYKEEIQKEIPEVDAIIGTTAIDKILSVIDGVLSKEPENIYADLNAPCVVGLDRAIATGGYYSYLKIAEGCDKCCTYCIIPKVRGRYRSVPIEELLRQANDLAKKGIKELILVAQETTLYGTDLYGKKSLSRLLRELCRIEGLHWIRLLYCYPEEIDDELIDTIASEEKICNYIDLPIQHASDTILKRMGRHTSQKDLRAIIQRLRAKIPDIAIRTTLISGFPGETQEDFEELYRFVNEMEFDRLGVFTYSMEENTPAAMMEDQIDESVKESRRNEIMELQQEIVSDNAKELTGEELEVIIDGKIVEDNVYIARTYKDAPNVDGYLFINADSPNVGQLMSGDFVRVKVVDFNDYDLIGEVINK